MLFGKAPSPCCPTVRRDYRPVLPPAIPAAPRLAARGTGRSDNEICLLRRFSRRKNHPGLLKIFSCGARRLPKARLVLLGGGEPWAT